MTIKPKPWWYHLAAIGHSVGVAIGAGVGTAALLSSFIPVYGPVISTAVGAIAGVATFTTHYADKGIAVTDAQE
jgi:hypothetical protein